MQISDAVIVITGGAQGLGRATGGKDYCLHVGVL